MNWTPISRRKRNWGAVPRESERGPTATQEPTVEAPKLSDEENLNREQLTKFVPPCEHHRCRTGCHRTVDRIAPIRRAALVCPRSKAEQARIRPPRRRPDPRPPLDWRELDDVGPDGRPLELVEPSPPAAELDHQVDHAPAIVDPPPRCEWVGPTAMTGGSVRKLRDDQLDDIRRERAAGASVYALARKYGVARNTIYAALKSATTEPIPCPAPDGESAAGPSCPGTERPRPAG
jgi:hypothetical protein